MSGERGEWSGAARAAAEAVGKARAVGDQLGLFGGPVAPEPEEQAERRGPGRPRGSRNAAKTGLAEYMAARGWRAPGEAVAQAAGLAEAGDGFEIAFRRACWLRASAIEAVLGDDAQAVARLAGDVMGLTLAIWREQNAAAAQLLPYTLQRLAPLEAEKAGGPQVSVGVTPPAQVRGGAAAALLAPADVRAKMQQDQGLGDWARAASDAAIRTGGASD